MKDAGHSLCTFFLNNNFMVMTLFEQNIIIFIGADAYKKFILTRHRRNSHCWEFGVEFSVGSS
jgi:hypothetical protein